ncbi:MAG: hypothetical protein KDA61_05895 [Planctomycetales bacterium]|nr:hypothetical protein [Planctomycetales bacterium]
MTTSYSQRVRLFTVCLAALLTVVAAHASAAVILDSGGFESFTNTALAGQQGWLMAGSATSTGTVQSSNVAAGSKAVRIDRGADSDARWAKLFSSTDFSMERYIRVSWDMNVLRSTTTPGLFGPFFGSEVYDEAAGFKLAGSLGVDAATGDVLYQAAGTGALAETGATVGFNQWTHFEMLLDYTTQTYRGFMNGTPLFTQGFVDKANGGGPLTQFSDADISALAAAPDAGSRALTGTAFFDNFNVETLQAADFNRDGAVDALDLDIWEGAFGLNASGDANGNGKTDASDFLIWQRQFDGSAAPALAASAAVPEPTACLLALLPLLAACRRRK